MKQINSFIRCALPAVLFILLFAGCQKTEFTPPPEGEKIPFNPNTTKDLSKVLSESQYKLFSAAWQRSTIAADQAKKNLQYTLLVPSDAAMQGAGYSANAIGKMAVNDVDSLVAFYTIKNKITKEELMNRASNYEGSSLRPRADLITMDGPANYRAQYFFRHYLGLENRKLLVNGLALGDVDASVDATNGYVFPIDKMIAIPNKSFVGALAADPRFSIFLEVQRQADLEHNRQYNQIYMDNYGFEIGDDYRRKYLLTDFDIISGQPTMFNMMFAPTDDAYRTAGFNSVEDVMEWNKRGQPMVMDEMTGEPTNTKFPSDTIALYHWDFGRNDASGPKPTIFYSNDLRNDLLGNYIINYDNTIKYLYYMPFVFSKTTDGKVKMHLKGSTAPEATIIETINTLMGPVHVIDRLLVPKDFKLK